MGNQTLRIKSVNNKILYLISPLDWPDGKSIMGSGASRRVEQDLPITHSVCINLLGGTDRWSPDTAPQEIKRVSPIRGMYLKCVCVCVRDSEIGSARVTPEDEKTTRKAGNMKGWLKTAERKRKKIKHLRV